MNFNFSSVPSLTQGIEITTFSKGYHLISQVDLGIYVKISRATSDILEYVNGKRTIKEIKDLYTNKSADVPDDVFLSVFNNLYKCNVLLGDQLVIKEQTKPLYLKVSFTIIKDYTAKVIADRLHCLYEKHVFLFLNLFCYGIVLYSLKNLIPTIEHFQIPNILESALLFGFSVIVVLFHEFGHASACTFYGAKNGHIGIGLYLLTPVLYADVSDAWRLKKFQRLVVNYAGIYMELITTTCVIILAHIFNKPVLNVVSLIFLSRLIINMNPFIRNDGYWILSDFLSIQNLRKHGVLALRTFPAKVKARFKDVEAGYFFLLAYGALSICSIVFFLAYAIFFWPLGIATFSENALLIFDEFNMHRTINVLALLELFLPAGFALALLYIIFRLLFPLLKKVFLRQRNKRNERRNIK